MDGTTDVAIFDEDFDCNDYEEDTVHIHADMSAKESQFDHDKKILN